MKLLALRKRLEKVEQNIKKSIDILDKLDASVQKAKTKAVKVKGKVKTRGTRGKAFTEKFVSKIKRMIANDVPVAVICSKLDISHPSVYRIKKAMKGGE